MELGTDTCLWNRTEAPIEQGKCYLASTIALKGWYLAQIDIRNKARRVCEIRVSVCSSIIMICFALCLFLVLEAHHNFI